MDTGEAIAGGSGGALALLRAGSPAGRPGARRSPAGLAPGFAVLLVACGTARAAGIVAYLVSGGIV